MKKLDLSTYKTAAGAAKALHKYLVPICKSWGQNPEIELNLLTPAAADELGLGPFWRVMWEAGPEEWGVYLSLGGNWLEANYSSVADLTGYSSAKWFLEPHYSFDVGFVTN